MKIHLKFHQLSYEASKDDPVMEDEIFGYILPVLELESLDSGIEFIKSKEQAVALYLFTKSREAQEKVLKMFLLVAVL